MNINESHSNVFYKIHGVKDELNLDFKDLVSKNNKSKEIYILFRDNRFYSSSPCFKREDYRSFILKQKEIKNVKTSALREKGFQLSVLEGMALIRLNLVKLMKNGNNSVTFEKSLFVAAGIKTPPKPEKLSTHTALYFEELYPRSDTDTSEEQYFNTTLQDAPGECSDETFNDQNDVNMTFNDDDLNSTTVDASFLADDLNQTFLDELTEPEDNMDLDDLSDTEVDI